MYGFESTTALKEDVSPSPSIQCIIYINIFFNWPAEYLNRTCSFHRTRTAIVVDWVNMSKFPIIVFSRSFLPFPNLTPFTMLIINVPVCQIGNWIHIHTSCNCFKASSYFTKSKNCSENFKHVSSLLTLSLNRVSQLGGGTQTIGSLFSRTIGIYWGGLVKFSASGGKPCFAYMNIPGMCRSSFPNHIDENKVINYWQNSFWTQSYLLVVSSLNCSFIMAFAMLTTFILFGDSGQTSNFCNSLFIVLKFTNKK